MRSANARTLDPARGVVGRRDLLAVAAALPFAACTAAADGARVALPDFRRPGDPDDSAALARAFATGRPVHAPAGRYRVGADATSTLPPGATLSGDGAGRTVIARSYAQDKPFILHCDSGSPDPAGNIARLRFSDLTFEDEVAARGFSEYAYLVMLNGVSDVLFDRVGFRGFRGDGLHLGSSVTSRTERHNVGVTVRDCTFDGVDANNRNAISVIDCAGLLVERSRFLNCTRAGDGSAGPGDPMNPRTGPAMPGAIDLEPNGDAFAVIRDVVVRDNLFRGGGGYAVALYLTDNDRVAVPQSGITVADNIVEDRAGGFAAAGFGGDGAARSSRGYGIAIRRNRVSRCAKPFLIDGIRGLTLAGNAFTDCEGAAELGYTATIADATLSGNQFVRVGSRVVPYGLWVRDSRDVAIRDNLFDDCGAPGGTGGIAVGFVGGVSRGLRFTGNRFRATSGRMEQAATLFRDARIDRATLTRRDNQVRLRGSGLLETFGPPR